MHSGEVSNLSSEELALRAAEAEREALRARLLASADSFRRAQAAGAAAAESPTKREVPLVGWGGEGRVVGNFLHTIINKHAPL